MLALDLKINQKKNEILNMNNLSGVQSILQGKSIEFVIILHNVIIGENEKEI
jgi:hypothetical protein